VPGSSWEVLGVVLENCEELATKSVLRLGGAVGSVISVSEVAVAALTDWQQSTLLSALDQPIKPS